MYVAGEREPRHFLIRRPVGGTGAKVLGADDAFAARSDGYVGGAGVGAVDDAHIDRADPVVTKRGKHALPIHVSANGTKIGDFDSEPRQVDGDVHRVAAD